MPKPIPLKLILKVLDQKGFVFVLQRGSHAKFRKLGMSTRTVIVKVTKKEVPYGTFHSILLQSGLQASDFLEKK